MLKYREFFLTGFALLLACSAEVGCNSSEGSASPPGSGHFRSYMGLGLVNRLAGTGDGPDLKLLQHVVHSRFPNQAFSDEEYTSMAIVNVIVVVSVSETSGDRIERVTVYPAAFASSLDGGWLLPTTLTYIADTKNVIVAEGELIQTIREDGVTAWKPKSIPRFELSHK